VLQNCTFDHVILALVETTSPQYSNGNHSVNPRLDIFILSVFVAIAWPLPFGQGKVLNAKQTALTQEAKTPSDFSPGSQDSFDYILSRYRNVMLAQPRNESDEELEVWLKKIASDGLWPDVDYNDNSRTGWKPYQHLLRMKAIAVAVAHKDSKYFQDSTARSHTVKSLLYWTKHRPKSLNWWYNRIGTPRLVRDVIVLLDSQPDSGLRDEAIDVLKQNRLGGTGANLLWTAETALHLGCLTRESEQVQKASDAIWNEINVGQPEGIQADWSFFQHGARLQTFSYGKFFLEIAVNSAWQLKGTKWEMPEDKKAIISNYLLDGMQWMSRGIYTVPSTMDRQFSRPDRLSYADVRPQLKLWMEVDQDRSNELEEFLARQNKNANPMTAFKHFHNADFTVYHRPAGSIFLKTISNRTKPTETTNRENLKGKRYLHSGDHYVMKDGSELEGIQPTLDWSRMPGITIAGLKSNQLRRAFNGGLGDGKSGLVAMDYARIRDATDKEKSVESRMEFEVRKTWFFHGDQMICLLGGWKTDNQLTDTIVTSIEQRLLEGDVVYANEAGDIQNLEIGQTHSGKIQWALHDGVGYMFLGDETCEIFKGPATGTWASINFGYRDQTNPVTKNVFRLYLNHAASPKNTGYVVVLDASIERMIELSKSRNWKVESNSWSCQAISFPGKWMAALFEPGAFEISGDARNVRGVLGAESNSPCLVMCEGKKLLLSCPDQEAHKIRFAVNNEVNQVEVEDGLPVGIEFK